MAASSAPGIEPFPNPIRDFFVDRKDQLDDFNQMLAGGHVRILCLHGDKSIGKTWLVEYLKMNSDGKHFPTASIDFSNRYYKEANQLEFLKHLAGKMGGTIQQAMQPASQAPARAGVELDARGDIKIGKKGKVIGGDEINVYVGEPPAGVSLWKKIAAGLGRSRPEAGAEAAAPKSDLRQINMVINKPGSQDQTDEVLQLTTGLIKGLEQLEASQYAVLFLDNFNVATPTIHDWIIAEILERIKSGEITKLIVVISNQAESIENLDELLFKYVSCKHILGNFDEATARLYCKKRTVDPEAVLASFPDRNDVPPAVLYLKAEQWLASQRQTEGQNAAA